MKIFIKIFSICVIILCFVSINTQNIFTDNQVSKAFLVEKYLLLHKEKITDYATKYKFIDDESIQNNLSKIDTLIISLKRIQNNNS
ncbi:MAG: hypothetical protein LBU14_03510 [Candidatus Peribacteria bacterium]|jgi:hypothetical protein|nr:hypothetical protein [Candidatus Peribacteria bacterium]